MKRGRLSLSRVCVCAGLVLILLSLAALLLWQGQIRRSARQAAQWAELLGELIPEPYAAAADGRSAAMPSLSVDGRDFAAILELPRQGLTLPVGATWGGVSRCPCRYAGSVYDGTLILGSTNQRGQLDCVKALSVGDALFLTDMTGGRYAYTITDILYRNSADHAVLSGGGHDLTLFVKNLYAFEYIILRCDAAGG